MPIWKSEPLVVTCFFRKNKNILMFPIPSPLWLPFYFLYGHPILRLWRENRLSEVKSMIMFLVFSHVWKIDKASLRHGSSLNSMVISTMLSPALWCAPSTIYYCCFSLWKLVFDEGLKRTWPHEFFLVPWNVGCDLTLNLRPSRSIHENNKKKKTRTLFRFRRYRVRNGEPYWRFSSSIYSDRNFWMRANTSQINYSVALLTLIRYASEVRLLKK
jgi:glycosyltransferase involved in cell wall biosynthesis